LKHRPFGRPSPCATYLVTGIFLGGGAPFILLSAFLLQRGKKAYGVASAAFGLCAFAGIALQHSLSFLSRWPSLLLYMGLTILVSLLAWHCQRWILTRGFSEEERTALLAPGVPAPWRDSLNDIAFWTAICYVLGLAIVLSMGKSFLGVERSKTLYLLSACRWACLSIPVGLLLGWLSARRVQDPPLVRVALSSYGLLLSGLALIAVVALLVFLPEEALPYGSDFKHKIDLSCPLEVWETEVLWPVAWVSIVLGAVSLGMLGFHGYRTASGLLLWRPLWTFLLFLSSIAHVSLLDDEHLYLAYSSMRVRSLSVEEKDQEVALRQCQRLVAREPRMKAAAGFLLLASRLQYELGRRDEAMDTLQQLLDTYEERSCHALAYRRAEHILHSMEKGQGPAEENFAKIDVLAVEKASYTSKYWLNLLTVLRNREPEVPEGTFKDRLRKISQEEERMNLPRVRISLQIASESLALGHRTSFLLLSWEQLKALRDAGQVPLAIWGDAWVPVVGYSEDRGTLWIYDYGRLFSPGERKWERRYGRIEKEEIDSLFSKAGGEEARRKKTRLQRKLLQEVIPSEMEGWTPEGQIPILLIDPEEDPSTSNERVSEGLLRMLQALWCLDQGDLEKAAQGFGSCVAIPELACLSKIHLWVSQKRAAKRIRDAGLLNLDAHFPETLEATFHRGEIAMLSDEGETLLMEALDEGTLDSYWMPRLLGSFGETPEEQEQWLQIVRAYLKRKPEDLRMRWHLIGFLRRWEREEELIEALQECLQYDSFNLDATLQLARLWAEEGALEKASKTIAMTDPIDRRLRSEYWYVRGQWALSKDRTRTAVGCFKRAIEKDKYEVPYHQGLQRALKAQGDSEGVEKEAAWIRWIWEGIEETHDRES